MNRFFFSTPKAKGTDPGYAKSDKLGHEALVHISSVIKDTNKKEGK